VVRKFLQPVALGCLLAAASVASAAAQDVAQSSLPIVSSDVSLIALFLQAHWVVKSVMLGLLACSVWVWAIAIDKIFLYSRTKRAMDRFEQAFWSGQSIEELYRALSAKPTQSMAACFVAAMREWKRSFESQSRSFAGLQMRIEKVMNVSIDRRFRRALCRPVRHRLGHHVELPVDRGLEKHLAGGGGPGHRGGAVCHRNRPYRRHSGDYFLQ
jgi:hypothetical protein